MHYESLALLNFIVIDCDMKQGLDKKKPVKFKHSETISSKYKCINKQIPTFKNQNFQIKMQLIYQSSKKFPKA